VDRLAALDGASVALGDGAGSTRKGRSGDEEGQRGGGKKSEFGEHFFKRVWVCVAKLKKTRREVCLTKELRTALVGLLSSSRAIISQLAEHKFTMFEKISINSINFPFGSGEAGNYATLPDPRSHEN
jgi:hypothetical protein